MASHAVKLGELFLELILVKKFEADCRWLKTGWPMHQFSFLTGKLIEIRSTSNFKGYFQKTNISQAKMVCLEFHDIESGCVRYLVNSFFHHTLQTFQTKDAF